MKRTKPSAKDLLMRYTPVAVALSLLVAVSSSVSLSAPQAPLDPRAAALVAQGHAALTAGDTSGAIDAYESALAVAPGAVPVLLGLADATRHEGLQGKALHYYRVALTADPRNVGAIAGEGVALAEKGAIEKAGLSLARLQTLCGKDCAQSRQVAAAIAKGPIAPQTPQVVSADAVSAKPAPTEQ